MKIFDPRWVRSVWNSVSRRGVVLVAASIFAGSGWGFAKEARVFQINDDGAWCWFQDERAIVHGGKLWVVSVAGGKLEDARRGNVEVATYELESGETTRAVLHPNLQYNDHATPALLALPDDRVFTIYSGHNHSRMFYRTTVEPNDPREWTEPVAYRPGEKSRVTYANLVRLSEENEGKGRIYNFFRGFDPSWKPSWMTSDDGGETWSSHGLWIDMPSEDRHRPYVKYIGNGRDTIHFIFTEGHPNNFDNSIYHAFYRDGKFHRTDGTVVHPVAEGPVTPDLATRVFAGSDKRIAWANDLHLDAEGNPVAAYSVQYSEVGRLPRGHEDWGQDLRYHYARWDGERWNEFQIAHAGTRLYAGEDDYTGLICIDPNDVSTVFISADVDPVSGEALAGNRYQIFRGKTADGGENWEWEQITHTEDADNLRPVVPVWDDPERVAVVWMRGEYRTYTDYELEMVGTIRER